MIKDKALQQALEALEELNNTNSYWWQAVADATVAKIDPAITAIKEALANHIEDNLVMVQEPKGMLHIDGLDKWLDASLKERKQRTWVGLTDDEAQWLYDNCRTPSNLIDMTEAKLKEKNT
jgi:hypothetical protein